MTFYLDFEQVAQQRERPGWTDKGRDKLHAAHTSFTPIPVHRHFEEHGTMKSLRKKCLGTRHSSFLLPGESKQWMLLHPSLCVSLSLLSLTPCPECPIPISVCPHPPASSLGLSTVSSRQTIPAFVPLAAPDEVFLQL